MALGQGRAEGVGVSDGVLGLDFGGFADEGVIHRNNVNRELIQQGQGLLGFVPTDPSLEDIVKFAPVDPGKKGLLTRPGEIAQKGFDFFPTGFLVEEAQQGETIEDNRGIHVFYPYGVPPGDRRSGKNPLPGTRRRL